MRILIVFVVALLSSEVGSQLGMFDFGGLDFLMSPPGYNEGPCIERQRRRRRRRKKKKTTVATPVSNQAAKPPTLTNTKVAPLSNTQNKANNALQQAPQQVASPIADPFLFPFENMFSYFDPLPAAAPPPPANVNPSNFKKSKTKKKKGIVIDYSKLTNSELQSLIKIAARQAGVNSPIKQASKPSKLTPISGPQKAPVKTPSYTDLVRQLEDLSSLATLQKKKVISTSKTQFRPQAGRRKRAATNQRSKRQLPLDLFGMGDVMPPSFCQCIRKSDVDSDHFIQSRKKYKCKRGLVCACSMGMFN